MKINTKQVVPLMAAVVVGMSLTSFAGVKIPADKSKFKIVVLAGQSNMAGRGTVDPANNKPHPRVVMQNQAGEWVPCIDPIHYDDPDACGVGPGKAFAEAMADADKSIVVGLVPTAIGGTKLEKWQPGATKFKGNTNWHPWDDMIARTKKAQEKGTLAAILWHQGESDCDKPMSFEYAWRFPVMIERFRKEVGAEGVPLIVGGLDAKIAGDNDGKRISAAQRWTCEYGVGPGKFVEGLDNPLQPDKIHYTAPAQQENGRRYFAAWQEVAKNLAKDKEYWKKQTPPADLKLTPFCDINPKYAKKIVPNVPKALPGDLEKRLFPKGRK